MLNSDTGPIVGFLLAPKSLITVLFIANIGFAAGSVVHDVYDLVGYSYFRLIDRIRLIIGRRGLSSTALKSIFEVGVGGDRRQGDHNEGYNCYESFPDGHGDDLPNVSG